MKRLLYVTTLILIPHLLGASHTDHGHDVHGGHDHHESKALIAPEKPKKDLRIFFDFPVNPLLTQGEIERCYNLSAAAVAQEFGQPDNHYQAAALNNEIMCTFKEVLEKRISIPRLEMYQRYPQLSEKQICEKLKPFITRQNQIARFWAIDQGFRNLLDGGKRKFERQKNKISHFYVMAIRPLDPMATYGTPVSADQQQQVLEEYLAKFSEDDRNLYKKGSANVEAFYAFVHARMDDILNCGLSPREFRALIGEQYELVLTGEWYAPLSALVAPPLASSVLHAGLDQGAVAPAQALAEEQHHQGLDASVQPTMLPRSVSLDSTTSQISLQGQSSSQLAAIGLAADLPSEQNQGQKNRRTSFAARLKSALSVTNLKGDGISKEKK